VSAPVLLAWFPTDTQGVAVVPLPVPPAPGLDGLQLFAQFGVLDAGSPLGVALTPGLRIVVAPN
jgi:hypothetical protein